MANWIEEAKKKGQIKEGAYGHHSAAQIAKDSKKGGKLGKRARLAKTLKALPHKSESLRERAGKALYGK